MTWSTTPYKWGNNVKLSNCKGIWPEAGFLSFFVATRHATQFAELWQQLPAWRTMRGHLGEWTLARSQAGQFGYDSFDTLSSVSCIEDLFWILSWIWTRESQINLSGELKHTNQSGMLDDALQFPFDKHIRHGKIKIKKKISPVTPTWLTEIELSAYAYRNKCVSEIEPAYCSKKHNKALRDNIEKISKDNLMKRVEYITLQRKRTLTSSEPQLGWRVFSHN